MKNINGRLEREIKELNKINIKLATLPKVIQDYYYYMEAADKSYSTIKNYINYITNFMNYCTKSVYDEYFYKNITSSTINEYMSSIRYKTKTNGEIVKIGNGIRSTIWSALNSFFTYLKANRLIDDNPMEQTFRPSDKQQKQVTFLTEKEIKKCINDIYRNCDEKFVNRNVCIFSLGVSTGLRVSAIAQINLEDIDFKNNTLQVIENGNKYRVINFGDNLKEKITKRKRRCRGISVFYVSIDHFVFKPSRAMISSTSSFAHFSWRSEEIFTRMGYFSYALISEASTNMYFVSAYSLGGRAR